MGSGSNSKDDVQNILVKAILPVVDDSIWEHVRGNAIRRSGDMEDFPKTANRPLEELTKQSTDRDVDATYSDKGFNTFKFMFVRAFNDATGAAYPAVDEHRRELIVPPEPDNWEFREHFYHDKIAEYVHDDRVAAIQLIIDDKYIQDDDRNRSTHVTNQTNRCFVGIDDLMRLIRMPIEFGALITATITQDNSWKAGFAGKGDPAIRPAPTEDSLQKYRLGLYLGVRSPLDWFNGLFLHQGPSMREQVSRYDKRMSPPTSRFGKAVDVIMVTPGDENFLGVTPDADRIHYVVIRRSAHVYAKHLGFDPGNGSFHIIPEIPPPKQFGKKISGDLEYAAWAANQYTELNKEDSQIVPVVRLPIVYLPWTEPITPLPGDDFGSYILPDTATVGTWGVTVLQDSGTEAGHIQAKAIDLSGFIDSELQSLSVSAVAMCQSRVGEIILPGNALLRVTARVIKDGNNNALVPNYELHGQMLFEFPAVDTVAVRAAQDITFDIDQIQSCNVVGITYQRDYGDPRDTFVGDVYLKELVGLPTDLVVEGRIWRFRAGDVLV